MIYRVKLIVRLLQRLLTGRYIHLGDRFLGQTITEF